MGRFYRHCEAAYAAQYWYLTLIGWKKFWFFLDWFQNPRIGLVNGLNFLLNLNSIRVFPYRNIDRNRRYQENLHIWKSHRWRIFQQHDSKMNLVWLYQSIYLLSNWSFYATFDGFRDWMSIIIQLVIETVILMVKS